jgi:predicted signal transduction protein with EAL and GGDEF domain
MVLHGCTRYIGASIGLSIYPIDGEDAENLLKKADLAMYCAKEQGRRDAQ